MATRKSRKFLGAHKHILILTTGLLILSISVWAISAHKSKPKSGTIPTTSQGSKAATDNTALGTKTPTSANTPSTAPNISASTTPISAKSTGSSANSDNTLTPSGTFVSNHKPSLSGTSAPSQEQSVCTTSPGATCVIQFVNKDGITKSLPVQTVRSSGSVTWDWDVKQAGFSQESWQITALASLNGQTKTATDAVAMQVQP